MQHGEEAVREVEGVGDSDEDEPRAGARRPPEKLFEHALRTRRAVSWKERKVFIENLLVRIRAIVEMVVVNRPRALRIRAVVSHAPLHLTALRVKHYCQLTALVRTRRTVSWT